MNSVATSERWRRIADFAFDPPDATSTFEQKVVRETGWTLGATRQAIDEYRRFLYLAADSGHRVSPSPIVDAVWHVHLLYTRNYWACCREVLQTELHHDPATGSPSDRASLDDAYARTLASYAEHFGAPPPADVWPTRPRQTPTLRVDPTRSVVLSRAAFRALVGSLVLSAIFIVCLLAIVIVHAEVGR